MRIACLLLSGALLLGCDRKTDDEDDLPAASLSARREPIRVAPNVPLRPAERLIRAIHWTPPGGGPQLTLAGVARGRNASLLAFQDGERTETGYTLIAVDAARAQFTLEVDGDGHVLWAVRQPGADGESAQGYLLEWKQGVPGGIDQRDEYDSFFGQAAPPWMPGTRRADAI